MSLEDLNESETLGDVGYQPGGPKIASGQQNGFTGVGLLGKAR